MDQLRKALSQATFKSLSDRPRSERVHFGLAMTWLSLALVLAAVVAIGRMIVLEDERAQIAALHQKTELWADAFDVVLAQDAERLSQLAIGLEERGGQRASEYKDRARNLMASRAEILEVSLLDSRGTVILATANTSPSGAISTPEGSSYGPGWFEEVLLRARTDESATFSEPYFMDLEAAPFVSLVIPLGEAPRYGFLAGRISIPLALDQAVKASDARGYRVGVSFRGRPVLAAAVEAGRAVLSHAAEIRLLPSGTVVQASTYAQRLFSQNLLFWVISALGVFLVIALLSLIRFTMRQNETQDALRAESSLRRAMSASHLIGIRLSDLSGRIVYVNETFCRMMHAESPEAFVGQSVPYSYWPEGGQRERIERINADLVSGRIASASYEFTPCRADGTRFDALVNITPLMSEEGAQLGWLGTITDITEVHEAQKHIAEAHRRFTLVVNSMQSAVSVVDPAGDVLVFSNPKYAARFGETPTMHLLVHEALSKRASRKPKTFTDVYIDADKSWFAVYEQTLTWTDGHDVRLQIATDVTQAHADQQLIHEQMLASEQNARLITMGEMASSLAHELNQPLAAIENYAYVAKDLMLEAGVPDEHELIGNIERIKNQAERAAGIISRVRTFTKRSEAKIEVTAVETIVRETWELAEILAKRFQAKIAHFVAPDVTEVSCDPILIEQVLLNLLRNGMEAAFELPGVVPEVTLTVFHDTARNVVFEVADNGPGIPRDVRSKLFDSFYSTKSSGMGMGLNICRTIVEMHHGRLTIEDNLRQGTIFRLLLPNRAKPAPSA